MYERILVPIDGTARSERIFDYVDPLVTRFGATVTLLRATVPLEDTTAALASVDGGGVVDPEEVVEEDQREASSYLAEMAQRLKSRGWTVEAEQAEGTPADAILDCAERMQADLIAMETHGRGGLARMVFGSEADRVLRHAPCPLLLVRMEEDGDE